MILFAARDISPFTNDFQFLYSTQIHQICDGERENEGEAKCLRYFFFVQIYFRLNTFGGLNCGGGGDGGVGVGMTLWYISCQSNDDKLES